MVGEIGGDEEEKAARFIAERDVEAGRRLHRRLHGAARARRWATRARSSPARPARPRRRRKRSRRAASGSARRRPRRRSSPPRSRKSQSIGAVEPAPNARTAPSPARCVQLARRRSRVLGVGRPASRLCALARVARGTSAAAVRRPAGGAASRRGARSRRDVAGLAVPGVEQRCRRSRRSSILALIGERRWASVGVAARSPSAARPRTAIALERPGSASPARRPPDALHVVLGHRARSVAMPAEAGSSGSSARARSCAAGRGTAVPALGETPSWRGRPEPGVRHRGRARPSPGRRAPASPSAPRRVAELLGSCRVAGCRSIRNRFSGRPPSFTSRASDEPAAVLRDAQAPAPVVIPGIAIQCSVECRVIASTPHMPCEAPLEYGRDLRAPRSSYRRASTCTSTPASLDWAPWRPSRSPAASRRLNALPVGGARRLRARGGRARRADGPQLRRRSAATSRSASGSPSGTASSTSQVLITNGSLQGLVAPRRAAARPGLAHPRRGADLRPHAAHRCAGIGAEPVPLPMDDDGLDPDALELALRRRVPVHDPDLPEPERADALARAAARDRRARARRAKLLVVEDDPYCLVRYEGERLPSLFELAGGRGCRLLVLVLEDRRARAPGRLPDRARRSSRCRARGTRRPDLRLAGAAAAGDRPRVRQPRAARAERRARRDLLRKRRDAMLGAFEQELPARGDVEPARGRLLPWVDFPTATTRGRSSTRRPSAGSPSSRAVTSGRRRGSGSVSRLAFSFVSPDEIPRASARLARRACRLSTPPVAV